MRAKIKKWLKRTKLYSWGYQAGYQAGIRAKNRLKAQGDGITGITMQQMVSEKEAEMHQELMQAKIDNGAKVDRDHHGRAII